MSHQSLESYVAAESLLEPRYLGSDHVEACNVAVQIGDPVLQAQAMNGLQARRVAMLDWRRRAIADITGHDEGFLGFLCSLPPEARTAILAGDVEIRDLATKRRAFVVQKAGEKNEARQKAKLNTADALRALILDADHPDNARLIKGAFPYPRFLIISESGETGFFLRRRRGIEWARAAGGRFLLYDISTTSPTAFDGEAQVSSGDSEAEPLDAVSGS